MTTLNLTTANFTRYQEVKWYGEAHGLSPEQAIVALVNSALSGDTTVAGEWTWRQELNRQRSYGRTGSKKANS
jgi:hypothetical protein